MKEQEIKESSNEELIEHVLDSNQSSVSREKAFGELADRAKNGQEDIFEAISTEDLKELLSEEVFCTIYQQQIEGMIDFREEL